MKLKSLATVFLSLPALALAGLVAAYAFSYLSFESTEFLDLKDRSLTTSYFWQIPFYLHVAFGGLALLIGGFQFFAALRERYPAWHRRAGTIYVTSVFISAICGLGIAPFADGGIVARTGFGLLAIAWLSTNYKAYTAIRGRRILEHRSWMIRNFALTFAAVALRTWLPLGLAAGMRFSDAYPVVAWLSWVPNLLLAEILVSRLTKSSRTASASQTSSLTTSEGLQTENANP